MCPRARGDQQPHAARHAGCHRPRPQGSIHAWKVGRRAAGPLRVRRRICIARAGGAPSAPPARPRPPSDPHGRRCRRRSPADAPSAPVPAPPLRPRASPDPAPRPRLPSHGGRSHRTGRSAGAADGGGRQAPRPPGAPKFTGDPVTLDFQGADLRAVLRTFAEISGPQHRDRPDDPGHGRRVAARRAVGPGARHHPARPTNSDTSSTAPSCASSR